MEDIDRVLERAQVDSIKVQALTQRISQLVAQYENEQAEFRAEATVRIGALERQIAELQQELTNERGKNEAKEEDPADGD